MALADLNQKRSQDQNQEQDTSTATPEVTNSPKADLDINTPIKQALAVGGQVAGALSSNPLAKVGAPILGVAHDINLDDFLQKLGDQAAQQDDPFGKLVAEYDKNGDGAITANDFDQKTTTTTATPEPVLATDVQVGRVAELDPDVIAKKLIEDLTEPNADGTRTQLEPVSGERFQKDVIDAMKDFDGSAVAEAKEFLSYLDGNNIELSPEAQEMKDALMKRIDHLEEQSMTGMPVKMFGELEQGLENIKNGQPDTWQEELTQSERLELANDLKIQMGAVLGNEEGAMEALQATLKGLTPEQLAQAKEVSADLQATMDKFAEQMAEKNPELVASVISKYSHEDLIQLAQNNQQHSTLTKVIVASPAVEDADKFAAQVTLGSDAVKHSEKILSLLDDKNALGEYLNTLDPAIIASTKAALQITDPDKVAAYNAAVIGNEILSFKDEDRLDITQGEAMTEEMIEYQRYQAFLASLNKAETVA